MHLGTHSCFNHFQTSQICNMENCVDMCARHGRRVIEICFSGKGALAKKGLGNTAAKHLPILGKFALCAWLS